MIAQFNLFWLMVFSALWFGIGWGAHVLKMEIQEEREERKKNDSQIQH
jgi:hypothetical protein